MTPRRSVCSCCTPPTSTHPPGSAFDMRQAGNAALADVISDEPYRQVWHRAQAIVGPDDEIADALVANVAIALGRGGVMFAIRDLQRAAQLTSDSARRGRRLLMAAEHAFA